MNYKTRQPFPHAAYVEGQRNFTCYDRSLTSGLTDVIINSPGDFLYIDQASTGVVSLELNMRQGGTLAPILLAAGGSIECDFASIKINASAQLNKTVRVVVGNGARIKSGGTVAPSSQTVQTVDGSRVLTDADKAHFGYAYAPAVAGQYGHAQLWNPATSGKNVYIDKLEIASPTTGYLFLASSTAAALNPMGTTANALSKRIGGTASVAQLRFENAAVYLSSVAIWLHYETANVPKDVPLSTPVLLRPGYGLIVATGAVNQAVTANFSTWEE